MQMQIDSARMMWQNAGYGKRQERQRKRYLRMDNGRTVLWRDKNKLTRIKVNVARGVFI